LASLRVERYGDVTRLRMVSAAGRAIGIDVSAYVVRGVMIDTGFARARDLLLRAARSLDIRAAIVTHWHEDHAGNVAALAALGTPLTLRADTEATLRSFPRIELYRRLVWGPPPSLADNVHPPDVADLACVHTPGHSSDHQIVWDKSTGRRSLETSGSACARARSTRPRIRTLSSKACARFERCPRIGCSTPIAD
jgi:glyoxylase-like metal-dependent hydrolase (beta-lactamase superfamily II)